MVNLVGDVAQVVYQLGLLREQRDATAHAPDRDFSNPCRVVHRAYFPYLHAIQHATEHRATQTRPDIGQSCQSDIAL